MIDTCSTLPRLPKYLLGGGGHLLQAMDLLLLELASPEYLSVARINKIWELASFPE